MAKGIYFGDTSNKARKVKNIYIGVDGIARKIKKAYIGVNGVAHQIWPLGVAYTYIGNSSFSGSAEGNWELKLTSSGTLNFSSLPTAIDLFMVGGGAAGGTAQCVDNYIAYGGAGGSGGQIVQITDGSLMPSCGIDITVTIGVGGTPSVSAGATTISSTEGSISASGGGGKAGGTQSRITYYYGETLNGGSGTQGTLAFDSGSIYYGASGGAGGARSAASGLSASAGGGAATGSGAGGAYNTKGADASTPNTGAGGGGGGANIYQEYNYYVGGNSQGGNGQSGIVIIRNHRS